MTWIINLFGSPGTGKSTTACELFAKMKHRGYEVELVREYVKELCWQGIEINNQLKCLAEQYDRQLQIVNKVDFIITDSPILLSAHYGADSHIEIPKLARQLHDDFDNFNIMLTRVKKYNPNGRYHSEAESDAMVSSISNLTDFDLTIDATENVSDKILKIIEAELFIL